MKISKQQLGQYCIGMLLAMPFASQVLADDIEIYVGNAKTTAEVRPNLVFIVDTSGSMSSNVVSQDGYDISVDYKALDPAKGCFQTDKIYFSTGRLPTNCGTSNYFNKSALKCDAAQNPLFNAVAPVVDTDPALASGWYQDRIARWRDASGTNRDYWTTLSGSRKDDYVECKTDSGEHGVDETSSRKYAANYAKGPYSNLSTESLDWNATGRGYVLYTGNYLNWTKTSPEVVSTRIEVVKDVTYNVVDSSNNINIGLMRFDKNSQGGSVRYPVEDVNAARGDFKSRLKNFTASGGTPLSEVLYENYLYWAGKDVYYGNTALPSNAVGVAVNGSGNKTYQSPIEYTCQKNFNIYLSDGEATVDGDADGKIQALPGFLTKVGACVGNCLDELAEYMHETDIYDLMDGEQTVATYTVGFAIDHELLKDTARRGGAKYYTADTAAELAEVFNQIIAEILSVNTTFSSPAVSINAFNRTTHRNDLYFTLFKPAVGAHWNGNLKRFKLVFDSNNLPQIVDAKDELAINDITGFFKDGAYSYWTDQAGDPDGGEVSLGGAAGQIGTRTVYTYTGATVANNEDLSASTNEFHENNTALTKTLLGIDAEDDAYRTRLIQWARGIDVYDDDADGSITDPRQLMGDPLHAEPALVQYGGTDADPDITSYIATNDGVLHAIDTKTGKEIFSFIPQETLKLQDTVYKDEAGSGKAYGLDGSVAALVIDDNKDGVIAGVNDKVYIYFGQRRGGNHYFAMDVTNRNAPKLMWVINGGAGDFAELGQTWSNIQIKKILVKGIEKRVGVFAGGYDLDQDTTTVRTADSIGRAVYMIDALTGERLWWAGGPGSGADLELANMIYSIPAKFTAVDVRSDGYLDRMYFGDMGGQIWRVDIAPGKQPSDDFSTIMSAQRIADLADGTAEGNRRFYYAPDVAFVVEEGKSPYLALAVSSGYRAHPLNTTAHDRIYMLKDSYIYSAPPVNAYGTLTTGITEADLYDASLNIIGQGDQTAVDLAVTELDSKDGWFIELKEPNGSYIGEKGLSEVLIIEGLVVATTYIPATGDVEACKPVDGFGYVYFMSLTDATPKYNFDTVVDSSDNLTAEDRRKKLTRGGIPPNPAPIFTKDGSAIIVGTEPVDNPGDDRPKKLYWYEDPKKNPPPPAP